MKQRQRENGTTQQQRKEGGDDGEAIQRRAFELYCLRGQEPGHELEDWLQAEREVRGEMERTVRL